MHAQGRRGGGWWSDGGRVFGYYADPVDESTAILPKGWKGRLVNLPPGNTEGVRGLCLEPHDLAIAKYVAGREKDRIFTRELAGRGIVTRERLVALLDQTSVNEEVRERILADVARDFDPRKTLDESRERRETGRQGPSTPLHPLTMRFKHRPGRLVEAATAANRKIADARTGSD
jgi:hypothetical protein